MALTSATAKPVFNIGSFDVDTELTIPSNSLKNKVTFDFTELVSEATPSPSFDPSGTTGNIFVLFSVTFNGENIYENPQFSATSGSGLTDPDITIAVSGWDANPAEDITINNPITMVTDLDGDASSGNYVFSLRYFWQYDGGGDWAVFQVDYPPVSYSYTPQTPSLNHWYDQGTPKLNVTDGQSYVLNGITADRDTEFVLSPPQNRAEVTNTFDNIQTVNYTSFWTGGNEITYTILLTYTFTDHIIVNAQQAYDAFTIYYVDNCTIYNCLKDQYDLWKSSTCGTKVAATAKDTLYEATSIALQITQGTGCNSDELSSLIEDFNELLECDCGCLDSTPRQLGSESTVLATDRQSVTANTATTAIDLSAGSTITVTVSASTTLDVSNIEQYTNYRFVFIADGGGDTVTFPSADFEGSAGSLLDRVPSTSGTLIMDFYASSATKLTLVSDSAA